MGVWGKRWGTLVVLGVACGDPDGTPGTNSSNDGTGPTGDSTDGDPDTGSDTPAGIQGPHGEQFVEDASGTIYGADAYEGAGAALLWVDADGDGDDDLLALADQETDPEDGPPYIGVWTELPTGVSTFVNAAWTVNNDLSTEQSRIRWMSAGDLSGDGQQDLLVERTLQSGGAETVLLAGPLNAIRSLAQSDAHLVFETGGEDLRWATVPDITGDGLDDLVAGDPRSDELVQEGGEAWVFAGPLLGRREPDLAFAQVRGSILREAIGGAMAAEDVDGDGIGDMVLAASIEHVYILEGPIQGSPTVQSAYSARWTYDPLDEEATSVYTSPVWVGDATGDGKADMLFGSQDLRLVAGPLTGELSEASVEATFPGATDFSVGDVNGDRIPDLLVGDGVYNPGVSAEEGIAFLYYGPMSGVQGASDATFAPTNALDGLGSAVGLGDGDGDGFDDVAIGVPGLDAGGVTAGAVLLFRGGA